MLKKIVFDNQEFHFKQSDLPILIHGKESSGSSLFTISMIADLFVHGVKLLVLTGYPMARAEFLEQTDNTNNFILATGNEQVEDLQQKQVIFLQKEQSKLFIELVHTLPDAKERVILIKNSELFDEEFFKSMKDLSNVIISGDIDACTFHKTIVAKDFTSKIYFSPLVADTSFAVPPLQKYEGYLLSADNKGTVFVKI